MILNGISFDSLKKSEVMRGTTKDNWQLRHVSSSDLLTLLTVIADQQ